MDKGTFNTISRRLLTLLDNRTTVGDAEFYRKSSKDYLNTKLFCNEIRKDISIFERFVKKGTILDLGCGIGLLSAFFAK